MHRFIRHNLHRHFTSKWRLYPCDWEKLWMEAEEGWCCRLEELRSRMWSGWTAGGWKTMSWAGWRSLLQKCFASNKVWIYSLTPDNICPDVSERKQTEGRSARVGSFCYKETQIVPKILCSDVLPPYSRSESLWLWAVKIWSFHSHKMLYL